MEGREEGDSLARDSEEVLWKWIWNSSCPGREFLYFYKSHL